MSEPSAIPSPSGGPKYWVRGDADGFFGLFIDNLVQILVIVVLLPAFCGLDAAFVIGTILPASAVSVLLGNVFYAWQAWRLARREGRDDVTALPYGINTPSLFAFIFFIMVPVYESTKGSLDPDAAARLAWQAGLFGCIASGVLECLGAWVAEPLRRWTPRAALLSALAGIAITFISMSFVFQMFASPAVAVIPMLLVVFCYAGKIRLPFGIPGGLLAVGLGATIAWIFRLSGFGVMEAAPSWTPALHLPTLAISDLWNFLQAGGGWAYASIILPMALFNVVGSLQNLESAEAAGDRFGTRSSLLANGLGTIAAACFGSPFPTTIYIGHPGWKGMGARIGYSVANGVAMLLVCSFGLVAIVLWLVPTEATLGILLWVGLIITAQAFQSSPREHALAVAFGLVPALAAWGLLLVNTALEVAGSSLAEQIDRFGSQLYIHGMIALAQGYLLTGMIWAAALTCVIRRQYTSAATWMGIAALASSVGLIHAWEMGPVRETVKLGWWCAPEFSLSYAGMAIILLMLKMGLPRSAPSPGNSIGSESLR